MIQGIVFDLDGVYFNKGKQEFVKILSSAYDLSEEEVRKVIFSSDRMSEYAKGKISSEEFWNYATDQWNIEADRQEIRKIFRRAYQVNPEIRKIIHVLREEDYKILACSNNYEDRVKALKEKFNFLKDFDEAVFSFEENKFKPELYEKVLDASSLKPQEVLVLDDDREMLDKLEERKFRTSYCENPGSVREILRKWEIL